jgi:hypothetical protein
MSDELEHLPSENNLSTFWPLLILVAGFLIWFGVQDFELNNQRSNLQKQLDAAQPTINEAHNIREHYVNLMKDVLQTAQKDSVAAQIVKDAIAAGWIHVQPPAAGTAPVPAPTDSSAPKP